MVRFDDVLTVDEDDVVFASGPVDSSKETIVELCAWVFQRGESDAAVTEMTHHDGDGHHLLKGEGEFTVEGNKWTLPLARVGKGNLTPGKDAFAVAVALIEDQESAKQQVIWWGHPVKLAAATA
jgi:hypothetical protein